MRHVEDMRPRDGPLFRSAAVCLIPSNRLDPVRSNRGQLTIPACERCSVLDAPHIDLR